MNRNTSFFWASDDLCDDSGLTYDVDDSEDEELGLNLAAPDNQMIPPPPPRDEESQPLVVATASGDEDGLYGTATSSVNQMNLRAQLQPLTEQNRTQFPLPREPIHVSRSPDLSRRKKPAVPKTTIQKVARELRFQVVIWHVGEVDVRKGEVPMRFRITMFWNDQNGEQLAGRSLDNNLLESEWAMKGRQRACCYTVGSDEVLETIDVPPISIMNAVSFDSIDAEVTMLDHATRLMRWTCMYHVTLFQADHMTVKEFPHDRHDLKLKIGVLAHRNVGARWDSTCHKLGLATDRDSKGSTKIPHGLVVEHVTIPDFTYNANDLVFEFFPLEYGAGRGNSKAKADEYLQVRLPVVRVSGQYDRSIMPILALLNVVAISCIPRNFASATASTGTLLSIAFVQVGIRLTIDSRLPSVGYPIKMQKILNHCFWLLCALAIESNVVFVLVKKFGWEIAKTDRIDIVAGAIALMYTSYILFLYYGGRRKTMPPHRSN